MGHNICTRNEFKQFFKSTIFGHKNPKPNFIFLTRPNDFNNLDNICVKNRANDFPTFKKLFQYFKMGLKGLGLNCTEKIQTISFPPIVMKLKIKR